MLYFLKKMSMYIVNAISTNAEDTRSPYIYNVDRDFVHIISPCSLYFPLIHEFLWGKSELPELTNSTWKGLKKLSHTNHSTTI
jgi:hypothetical protein